MPKKKKTFLSKLAHAGVKLFREQWLEQYAAICYRRTEPDNGCSVLLITSRGSGRWVIPKGSPMKGKKPRQVAAREAFEEAGIKGKPSKKPIGRYAYLKQLEGGENIPCVVDVFTLEVAGVAEAFKEHGQRQFQWVAPTVAARLVEEPELRGLFIKLDAKTRANVKLV